MVGTDPRATNLVCLRSIPNLVFIAQRVTSSLEDSGPVMPTFFPLSWLTDVMDEPVFVVSTYSIVDMLEPMTETPPGIPFCMSSRSGMSAAVTAMSAVPPWNS
jgi:hypothetical protein